ncbi:hypothetical protein K491DRAFT_784220 [Lophiostoma macrostomum CBS 122681]|uniref:Rhodopsin domain-containing protein n=1 Tax=Lophiostoma macrostomum CBS 122681 TaxID=1314788 RepID=A0A6A6SMN4_9PLEO|nr:hypothetical protein K491DRAFT_784220 [Lophiostoma macrostomum CBS 122681]
MEEYLKSPISKTLVVVPAVFEGLATVFVALRFYLRLKLKQGVKWDDWLALLSLIASWGYAIGIFTVASQIGIDTVKVDPFVAAQKFVEAVAIGSFLLIFVVAPIKISVLLFYKRIFGTGSPKFNLCVWVAIGIVSAWGLASFVAQLLIADPVPLSAWNDLANPKYRFDYFKFGLSVPVLSIIFDGIILLFPLPSLRKLQLPLQRKLQVLGIFWLGAFCLVTGGVRIHFWYKNAELVTDSSDVNVNKWQYDTLVQVWVFLEMTVSIIAACLPTLAPIVTSRVYSRITEKLYSLSSLLRRSETRNTKDISEPSSKRSGGFQRFGSGDKFGSGEIPVVRQGCLEDEHAWSDVHSHHYDDRFDGTDIELAQVKADYTTVGMK